MPSQNRTLRLIDPEAGTAEPVVVTRRSIPSAEFQRMFERIALQVSVVLSLAASAADAQLANGKWRAPAKGSGSSGTAAPKQGVQASPPVVTATRQSNNAVVPIRVIHAVLMSDGSVQADFGAGLVPVSRSCGGDFRYTPLRIIGSLPAVPGQHPAPGMQPAPAPLTESQKALPSAQARAAAQQAAQASCHLRDAKGRFFATR
jgi:hypothetical protein